jgi:four helix bundle protein
VRSEKEGRGRRDKGFPWVSRGYASLVWKCRVFVMRDHKSLLAWQEAHAVVLALLPAIRSINHAYANPSFVQLQRAALSVQMNIAEGYALKASKRFRSHLDIAYGSAVETAELLELSGELCLLSSELIASTLKHRHQCQRLLRGLINHLRTT